jgi:ketosteroid isomerase-like protein
MRTGLRTALIVVMVVVVAGIPRGSAVGQMTDEDAVKKTLEEVAEAFNARDVKRYMSYCADDAKVESRSAGGIVGKVKYTESIEKLIASGRANRTAYRDLTVSLSGPMHAVVEGGQYNWDPKSGAQRLGARYQWKLEKREGRWLIVETMYKR